MYGGWVLLDHGLLNFLITAAFTSKTCECSLPVLTQKIFLFVTSKSSVPVFVLEARDNWELPRQVFR